ncbi:MAG: hypothetical protein FD160_3765 [Caulobacteraceae bacterium]|nr:MAG: hypothetical protein FD160_3765 [Caulobacteraceae bacterium]
MTYELGLEPLLRLSVASSGPAENEALLRLMHGEGTAQDITLAVGIAARIGDHTLATLIGSVLESAARGARAIA